MCWTNKGRSGLREKAETFLEKVRNELVPVKFYIYGCHEWILESIQSNNFLVLNQFTFEF